MKFRGRNPRKPGISQICSGFPEKARDLPNMFGIFRVFYKNVGVFWKSLVFPKYIRYFSEKFGIFQICLIFSEHCTKISVIFSENVGTLQIYLLFLISLCFFLKYVNGHKKIIKKITKLLWFSYYLFFISWTQVKTAQFYQFLCKKLLK